MTKSDKIEIKEEIPVFRNITKIDQVVYDKSYTTVTVPPGETVEGEWYKRYAAGKRSPFVLVDSKDVIKDESAEKKEVIKDDKNKGGVDSKSEK